MGPRCRPARFSAGLREGGDKSPWCCVEWGDGQACRVRKNELKESFSE